MVPSQQPVCMEVVGGPPIFAYLYFYGTGSTVLLVRNAAGICGDGRDLGPALFNLRVVLFHFSSTHMVLFE